MGFTRQFLLDNGVPEENVDAIMAERSKGMNGYVRESEVQQRIDAAVAAVKPVDVKTTDEYLTLMSENNKLKAFQGDDFASVKSPYRDMVWDKLDHGEKHPDYKTQLAELQKTMPDIFVAEEQKDTHTPTFGGGTHGSAPSGQKGSSFMDTWGFIPKKTE